MQQKLNLPRFIVSWKLLEIIIASLNPTIALIENKSST